MGPLGWQETMFIFILALLIFGPKKLPEMGKTIGKAITEFRRASSEFRSTWEREVSNLEQDKTISELKQVAGDYNNELHNGVSPYSYEEGSPEATPDDPYAEYSSPVSASATEGAEPTADAALEHSVAEAEMTEPGTEVAAIEADGSGPEAVPVTQPSGGQAPESHSLAG